MDRVEQLLADLAAGNIADAEALAARVAELDDEEVGALEAQATEQFDAIMDGTAELEEGVERLDALNTLADVVDATRADADRRYTEAAAAAEAEAQIAQRVHGETQPEGGDGGDGGDGGGEGEGDNGGDGGGDDGGTTVETTTETTVETAETEPEPVPASATPPRIGRIAVRRMPERVAATPTQAATTIIAAADGTGVTAGGRVADFEQLSQLLSERAEDLRSAVVAEGSVERARVATIRASYPAEQDLRAIQRNPQAVEQAVTAAIGRDGERYAAITAAGGFCAPAVPLYDQISIADAGRPARMALPSFQAQRGRVIYMPSPNWTGYASGVRKWTSTNDTEALSNSNVRKPCVRVDCPSELTAEVYAIPVCVTVGNFFDRTFDERRQAILDDVMAWQARFAERELLQAIADHSTTVTAGQTLGTIRDVLAILDRAMAGFISRYRVRDDFRMEWWAPRWLRNNMRADLVRALPVSGASLEENLAVADAQIERLIAARGINVTWLWDGERGGTDQEFGAEAGGSLQNWPTRVISYLFHPGAHRFLDGGELNLGVQRDSTLNATNDLQIWSETFEGAMHPGLESLRIDMDVCPSGEIAGTVDTTGVICTTGS